MHLMLMLTLERSRGWANNRLVTAKTALQHNLGLGGAVVINVYKRADGQQNKKLTNDEIFKASPWDYNPAIEAKYASKREIEKVRSKNHRVEYALGDTEQKIQARL